eukprot:6150284-Ditylum_brightwellii.AAC.1
MGNDDDPDDDRNAMGDNNDPDDHGDMTGTRGAGTNVGLTSGTQQDATTDTPHNHPGQEEAQDTPEEGDEHTESVTDDADIKISNPDNNVNQETNETSNTDPNNDDNPECKEDGDTQAEHEAPGIGNDDQTEIAVHNNTQSTGVPQEVIDDTADDTLPDNIPEPDTPMNMVPETPSPDAPLIDHSTDEAGLPDSTVAPPSTPQNSPDTSDSSENKYPSTPRHGVSWADAVRDSPSPACGISKAFRATSASIECKASTIKDAERKHKQCRQQRRKRKRDPRNNMSSSEESVIDDGADKNKANEPYKPPVAPPNEIRLSERRVYDLRPRCTRTDNTKYTKAEQDAKREAQQKSETAQRHRTCAKELTDHQE